MLLDLPERFGLESSCEDVTSVERRTRIDRSLLLWSHLSKEDQLHLRSDIGKRPELMALLQP